MSVFCSLFLGACGGSAPVSNDPSLKETDLLPARTSAPKAEPTAAPDPDSLPAIDLSQLDPKSIRYVSHVGDDANDGLTEATAWRRIDTAVSRAVAGQVIFVRAGLYVGESIAFPRSGTADKPIQVIGYTRVPGDVQSVANATYPRIMDASVLPLLDGGNRAAGVGVQMSGQSHIVVRNLQIRNYLIGVYGDGTSNSVVDNVFAASLGDVQADYSGVGIKMGVGSTSNLISNSMVENAASEGIMVFGDYNTVSGCRVYANDNSTGYKSSTDYYIMTGGNYNVIKSNIAHRIGALGHGGHGIGAKTNTQHNLFEDNLAINFDGSSYYVRHRGSMNNLFRRNRAEGGAGWGFTANEGANRNRIENHHVVGSYRGIAFYDTSEDGGLQSGGNYNTFVDVVLEKIGGPALFFHDYTYADTSSTGNVFERLTVNGAAQLFDVRHKVNGTQIRNSLISNVGSYASYYSGRTAADLGVLFEGTQFSGNGFGTP